MKKQLFSTPEATGEVVPLFLAKREDRLVVLAVLNKPTAAEELFLVRIDAAGKAAWVPVAKKVDPQCSFIAGRATPRRGGLPAKRRTAMFLYRRCRG